MELVVVHWQGRLAEATVVASLYMAEAELLAGLELAVQLVVVLVHVLREVQSQGRRGWMRKIGVDHNTVSTIANMCKWKYLSSGEPINKEQIFAWFPYQEILQNLNIYTRTGQFQDKSLYLNDHKEWRYLNH